MTETWKGSDSEATRVGSQAAGEPDAADIEILSIEGAAGTSMVPEEDAPEARTDFDGSRAAAVDASEREESQFAALEERYLRLLADFDNYRKRSEREREEAARRGVAQALGQLLPVLDNLERALAAAVEGSSGGDLVRGVELIVRQLADALRRLEVHPVPGVGSRFDPEIHEAVAQESSSTFAEPTVVAEFQRGYRFGDRLLRPAMVRVAVPERSDRRDAETAARPESD